MERDQIKEQLHLRIEQADDRLLRVMSAMVEAYFEVHPKTAELAEYENSLRPMTQEELVARAMESEAAIERGEVIDVEEILNPVAAV